MRQLTPARGTCVLSSARFTLDAFGTRRKRRRRCVQRENTQLLHAPEITKCVQRACSNVIDFSQQCLSTLSFRVRIPQNDDVDAVNLRQPSGASSTAVSNQTSVAGDVSSIAMRSCILRRRRRPRSATAFSCFQLIGLLHGALAIITSIPKPTPTSMRRGHADDAALDYHSFNVSASYATAGAVANATLTSSAPATSMSVITDSDLKCLSELPVEKLLRIRKTLRYVSHMLDTGVEPPPSVNADRQHSYATPAPSASSAPSTPSTPPPLAAEEIIGPRRRSGTEPGRYVGADGYAFEGVHRADGAQSAALIMDHIKKVGYADTSSDYGGWVEEKPSKVQKIFNFSVTTLAFLAFGGYLLCMIVQAIKSKGTTYYHPAMLPMTTAGGTGGTGEGLSQISQISIKRRRPVRHRRNAANATQSAEDRTNGQRNAAPSPDELYNILVLAAEGYVKLNVVQ